MYEVTWDYKLPSGKTISNHITFGNPEFASEVAGMLAATAGVTNVAVLEVRHE